MTDKVQLKRKVTIRVKHPEKPHATDCISSPPSTPDQPIEGNHNNNGGNVKKWIALLAAILLALVAFLLYKGCSDKQASTEVDAPAQSAGTTASVQDSTRRDTVSNVDTASSPMPSETQSGSNAEVPRDERVQPSSHTTVSKTVAEPAADNASVETKAKEVIRGKYGNGQIRKDRLGASYTEIQGRVNEMYRQGLVN